MPSFGWAISLIFILAYFLRRIKVLHLFKWMGYIVDALAKSNVRRENLKMYKATIDAQCVFFYVVGNAYLMANYAYTNSMVALLEHPKGWLVTLYTSILTSDNVTTLLERENSGGDSFIKYKENIIMMAIPTLTQFKFLFLSVKRADTSAKPCRLEVTASNEHDARLSLSRDYVLSFAGQIPLRTGGNAQ